MHAQVMAPTRVLHVLRPAVGGMKGHVLQLATGLRAFGFSAEVACPGDSDVVKAALDAGLEVRPVNLVGPLSPWHDFEAILALRGILLEGRYQIVHAHGFKAGLVARVAAMLARCPRRVVTVHNHVLYRDISRVTKWVYVTVERWLSRHTSRIITVSDALRNELIEEYGIDARRIRTIHNGIDLAPFVAPVDPGASRRRYGLPSDALVLGGAARFAPQKAMDVLVNAAVPVLESLPTAWLLLAGDGPLLDEVKKLAAATPVADRILFPGFEADIRALLGALDVYVSAALSEGLPLATIEAMGAALPVVSTRAGGTPEVVDDGRTGLLAALGDLQGLSDAMLRLARERGARTSMGAAGRERALQEFGEARMLKRTAEVYRGMMSGTMGATRATLGKTGSRRK